MSFRKLNKNIFISFSKKNNNYNYIHHISNNNCNNVNIKFNKYLSKTSNGVLINVKNSNNNFSNNEDLFKLFAWRECDNREITSITTPASSSSFKQFNKISIKPIKTMNHLNSDNLRVLFLI